MSNEKDLELKATLSAAYLKGIKVKYPALFTAPGADEEILQLVEETILTARDLARPAIAQSTVESLRAYLDDDLKAMRERGLDKEEEAALSFMDPFENMYGTLEAAYDLVTRIVGTVILEGIKIVPNAPDDLDGFEEEDDSEADRALINCSAKGQA